MSFSLTANRLFSHITDGIEFSAWCERVSEQALRKANAFTPPFHYSHILRENNIKLEFKENMVVPGQLKVSDHQFVIQISDRLKPREKEDDLREVVAHEYAHSFLYESSLDTWKDVSHLPSFSFWKEYFARRLADSFLIPEKLIAYQFELSFRRATSIPSKVEKTKKLFQVSDGVVLRRLIGQLMFLDTIAFSFKKFTEEVNPTWRLISKYYPEKLYNQQNFIPNSHPKRKVYDPTKYPSVGDKLNQFLESTINEFKNQRPTPRVIQSSVQKVFLEDKPIGKLISNEFRSMANIETEALCEGQHKLTIFIKGSNHK